MAMKARRVTTIISLAVLTIGFLIAIAALLFIWLQHKAPSNDNEPHPEPAPAHTAIDDFMNSFSLRDKVASLFVFHAAGTDSTQITAYMHNYQPGGFIFMGDNIPGAASTLPTLTKATVTNDKLPPFIAVDQEGGIVARVPGDTSASADTLRNLPPEDTKQAFTLRSHLLKDNGFNLNFGIIADVTSDPNSFIYPRILGTSAEAAAERVKAAVEGSAGLTLSTIKHFPGHGETSADSHVSIPTAATSYDDWKNRVAVPFQAGITAGADMMMFGHLRYSAIDAQPATLSKKWHDIARKELGFKGIIITDDMLMLQNSGEPAYTDPVNNAVTALQAGSELLLYVLDHGEGTVIDPNTLIDGVTKAVENGEISKEEIDKTVRKLLTLRHNLAASN